MGNEDLASASIQIIGVVIGAGVSIFVSRYYFKKSKYPAQVTAAMIEDVLRMLIQMQHGIAYCCGKRISRIPRDRDRPHIVAYWLSAQAVTPGERVDILVRVQDEGMNFSGEEFINIAENEARVAYKVRREGFGFYSCTVNVPQQATPGIHTLSVHLVDNRDKEYMQDLTFAVV